MINADVKGLSLNETVVALWCAGPVHATYFTSTFEFVWERSVDATHRILELLKEEDPPIEGC
ncbi:MAG: hypothetical protein WCE81_09925 [Halobacteriota archaeon]